MKKCLNCGQDVSGRYCSACGQKTETVRYAIRSLLGECCHAIIHFDSNLIRTAIRLSTRPGSFIRDYLFGKRKNYASPLKYLILVLTLNVAVTFLLNKPALAPVVVESWQNDLILKQVTTLLTHLIFFVLMLPFAATLKLCTARSGYTFVEYYCFFLYMASHSILVFILIQLVMRLFGVVLDGPPEGILWSTLFILFYFWFSLDFLRGVQKRIPFRIVISYVTGVLFLIVILLITGNILKLVLRAA